MVFNQGKKDPKGKISSQKKRSKQSKPIKAPARFEGQMLAANRKINIIKNHISAHAISGHVWIVLLVFVLSSTVELFLIMIFTITSFFCCSALHVTQTFSFAVCLLMFSSSSSFFSKIYLLAFCNSFNFVTQSETSFCPPDMEMWLFMPLNYSPMLRYRV